MTLPDPLRYSRTVTTSRAALWAALWTLLVACFLFAACHEAAAANVVLIQKNSGATGVRQQLEQAAGFYGLSLKSCAIDAAKGDVDALKCLRAPELIAVVVDVDALTVLNQKKFLTILVRNGGMLPLMIAGVNEHTDVEILKQWSLGAVRGVRQSNIVRTDGWYAVGTRNEVTRELSGTRLPLLANSVPYLHLKNGVSTESILEARNDTKEFPVFVRSTAGGHNVFIAAETSAVDIPTVPDPYRQQAVFASLAPSMLFLHYAAGEHAWHSNEVDANFTIDDLWLREPYGHVNYEELLKHAEQHDFHATIAFIPWNFDRSEARMAVLFREHADRLSICVHGNNHVHQEFGPLDSHPLQEQIANMQQGLARMERFTALTGVPYDAVMVFPHSIAPEATFAELRRSHYLATANSLNVPSDAAAPRGVEFALRTATLRYGDFPSLRRYSVETDIPRAQLAIDAFLGNPMLFYAHESFFATGIDAFDRTADLVNELKPGTKWRSLGYIARHLYLERLRDDGNYDVRAYSASAQITNAHGRDADFYVVKDEDFSRPLTVLVDGKPYSFERSGSQLQVRIRIQTGSTREVAVRYGSDVDLANIDTTKNSLKTNAIRLLSDFRDNTISNTEAGRLFIRSYADNGRAWNFGMGIFATTLIGGTAVHLARKRRKSQHAGSRIEAASQLG
jgi:peptidoglycan/xylan/chitin deacetylase (PgdA/CDA1 family)